MNRHTLLGLIGLLLAAVSHAADLPPKVPPKVFPHPDRIRYDSQCFTIEGKDTFIFSGAFHYFRCPKELWNDRFDKIKAAGFNCVETYVAWNVQEPAMPASVDDYSKVDMKDLDDWLTMAEAHGLYVILRPGPYICAEWDCGGFPQWLLTKKPAGYHTGHLWLRSDDPVFVAWSKHWFHAVDQVAVKHQITHRKPDTGGIIIYQLENEYGGHQPDDVEVRYLHALGQQAMDDGIDVPFMTCWTAVVRGSADPILRQCYDTCNLYPRWNVDSIGDRIDKLRREQPDAPLETTELQGGWFANIGKENSLSNTADGYVDGCTPAQIQNLTLHAIAKGDRVINYYMLFGGTNFGDHAPEGVTTSYDYSAPIRECGGVGEKYQRVAAIAKMLREHGAELARTVPIECEVKADQKDVSVSVLQTADGGALYFFVRTNQHAEARRGRATIKLDARYKSFTLHDFYFDYDLEPFGSNVFRYAFSGVGPPVQSSILDPVAAIARPAAADLPAAVGLKFVAPPNVFGDMPAMYQPITERTTLEQLGIYDRRYVFYRTHIHLDAPADTPVLQIDCPKRDHLLVAVNNRLDPAITAAGTHAAKGLQTGDNTIDILYENVGQRVGGAGMEEMGGIRGISLHTADAATADHLTGWRMLKEASFKKPWAHPETVAEFGADYDDSKWPGVKADDRDASQLAADESAVFRTRIHITAEQLKLPARLVCDRLDDEGWVIVNGKQVGEGHHRADHYTFPVDLHEGDNSVAIVVHNIDARGGLGPVHLEFGAGKPGLPLEIGLETNGFKENWWANDAAKWTEPLQAIKALPASNPVGLTWSRSTFELPAVKPHVWVPWVGRLDIGGNAFLYLNGHPLGRYWAVGPQHDFFLPECWLNFGPGKTNVLTICGHGVGADPFAVKSAQAVPLNELAEVRQ